jgi:tetratricopeptide (TPR) repeat protein
MNNPLCFVLMPFGKKSSALGSLIDFDAIYQDLIYPAIKDSGLEPLRADEEMTGGIIHKPMFERLILCEYAVADLTNANANVFYELGVRHAVRPWSTVLLYAKESGQLPFDVAPLRAMAYHLTPEGAPQDLLTTRAQLLQNLIKAKESQNSAIDSPIFQLVEGFPQIDHIKTDVFRDRVSYSARIKEQIADARIQGREALMRLERELGNMNNIESGVVIDLFLSYRAVEAYSEMIALVKKMSRPLAETVMVQEQLALALNRGGKGEQAERVLLDLLEKRGPSSETYGILGRIYKDRWETAFKSGDEILAMGLLDQAIEAYVHGFEADWRDAYPGINAVTLMEIKEPPDPRRLKMIPVVEYAVERRIGAGKPDYWDYATRLELAVLAKDKELAVKSLSSALTLLRESWEAETTVRNLRLIRQAREFRQDIVQWYSQIEQRLETRSNQI